MPCSRVILDTEQLKRIVDTLAEQLSSDFSGVDNPLALIVLEGAKYFAEDLIGKLNFSLDAEYINASSYSGTASTGHVKIENSQQIEDAIRGRNILLIDDIYDTGLTLHKLLQWLQTCGAGSVKTCVLLEKDIPHEKHIDIDYLGSSVEDAFLIGYGLDYNGQYRDLPYIGVLDDALIGSEPSGPLEEIAD